MQGPSMVGTLARDGIDSRSVLSSSGRIDTELPLTRSAIEFGTLEFGFLEALSENSGSVW